MSCVLQEYAYCYFIYLILFVESSFRPIIKMWGPQQTIPPSELLRGMLVLMCMLLLCPFGRTMRQSRCIVIIVFAGVHIFAG